MTHTSPTNRPSRAGHLALPERGDLGWTTRAACHGQDTEGWILDGIWSAGRTADVARRVERARAVCADCPVIGPCLADAVLTADGWAVRAGTTPAQRAAPGPGRPRHPPQGVVIVPPMYRVRVTDVSPWTP